MRLVVFDIKHKPEIIKDYTRITKEEILKTIKCVEFLLGTAVLFLISNTMATAAPAASDQLAPGDGAVAVINGVRFTLAEIEQKQPTALFQARNTFFETEKKVVDQFVEDYLLELQAGKEHLTVKQLLDMHASGTAMPEPSEESLRLYYEGTDSNEPFEAIKGKILDHIHERRATKAKTAYIQALRSQAQIAIQLNPPRAQVSLKTSPLRGPAGAPITFVEYADYECPYCQQVQPDLDKLEAEYKDKIAFAYKDLPLPMHPHAQKAAEASQCAGLQNKYWEYHDVLLKTKELEIPQLKTAARSLNLDGKAFDECLDSGKTADAVKANLDEATRLGLTGTPSFFLNGRFFSGVMPYEQMRQMVEEELQHSTAKPQQTGR